MLLLTVAFASIVGRQVREQAVVQAAVDEVAALEERAILRRGRAAVEGAVSAELAAATEAALGDELAAELGGGLADSPRGDTQMQRLRASIQDPIVQCRASDTEALRGPGPCSCAQTGGAELLNDCPAAGFCWTDQTCNLVSRVNNDRRDCRAADGLNFILPDSPRNEQGERHWDVRLPIPGEEYSKNIYVGVRNVLLRSGRCEGFITGTPTSTEITYAMTCDAEFSAVLLLHGPKSGFISTVLSLVSGEKDVHGTAKVRYNGIAKQVFDEGTGKLKWDYTHEQNEVKMDLGGSSTYMDAVFKIVSAALNRLGGLNKIVFDQVAMVLQNVMPADEIDDYIQAAGELQDRADELGQHHIDDDSAVSITVTVDMRTPALGEPLAVAVRFGNRVIYPSDDLNNVVNDVRGIPAEERLTVDALDGLKGAVHAKVLMEAGVDKKLEFNTAAPEKVTQCFTMEHLQASGGLLMCPQQSQRIIAVEPCETKDPYASYRASLEKLRAAASGRRSSGMTSRLEAILGKMPTPPSVETVVREGSDAESSPAHLTAQSVVRELVGGSCVGQSTCQLSRQVLNTMESYSRRLRGHMTPMSFTCSSSSWIFGADTQSRTKGESAGTSLYFDPEIPGFSLFRDDKLTGPADRGAEYQILVTTAGRHHIRLQARLGEAEYDQPDLNVRVKLTKVGVAAPVHNANTAIWSPAVTSSTRIRDKAAGFLYHDLVPGGADLEVGAYKIELVFNRQELQQHQRAFQIDRIQVEPPNPEPTALTAPVQLLPNGADASGLLNVEIGDSKDTVAMAYVQAICNKLLENFGTNKRKPFQAPEVPVAEAVTRVNDAFAGDVAATAHEIEGVSTEVLTGVKREMAALDPSMLKPREVTAPEHSLKKLFPYAEVSTSAHLHIENLSVRGAEAKSHMVLDIGMLLQAKVRLNPLVQTVLNPQGAADFGYPFYAGHMQVNRRGRGVLLNCGKLQIFESTEEIETGAPAVTWDVEGLQSVTPLYDEEAAEPLQMGNECEFEEGGEWVACTVLSAADGDCADTAGSATDIDRDGCSAYDICHNVAQYDDKDFSAADMCCVCGGGETHDADGTFSVMRTSNGEGVKGLPAARVRHVQEDKCVKVKGRESTIQLCAPSAPLLHEALLEQAARFRAADPRDPITGTQRPGVPMFGLPAGTPVVPLRDAILA